MSVSEDGGEFDIVGPIRDRRIANAGDRPAVHVHVEELEERRVLNVGVNVDVEQSVVRVAERYGREQAIERGR